MTADEQRAWLAALLADHRRVAIAGGPRAGKSTMTEAVEDRPVIHTDDFNDYPWEEVPGRVIDACAGYPSFVVEGVHAARALRKGLEVDAVAWVDEPVIERNAGQAAMAKGIATVMRDWVADHPDVPLYLVGGGRVGAEIFDPPGPRATVDDVEPAAIPNPEPETMTKTELLEKAAATARSLLAKSAPKSPAEMVKVAKADMDDLANAILSGSAELPDAETIADLEALQSLLCDLAWFYRMAQSDARRAEAIEMAPADFIEWATSAIETAVKETVTKRAARLDAVIKAIEKAAAGIEGDTPIPVPVVFVDQTGDQTTKTVAATGVGGEPTGNGPGSTDGLAKRLDDVLKTEVAKSAPRTTWPRDLASADFRAGREQRSRWGRDPEYVRNGR